MDDITQGRKPFRELAQVQGPSNEVMEDARGTLIFYTALFGILEGIYRMSESDDVGALLGDMSLLPDGASADAEVLSRWQSYGDINSEQGAYECAVKFLDREVELTQSSHLAFLANTMRGDRGHDANESLVRKAWLHQVERARNGLVRIAMVLNNE